MHLSLTHKHNPNKDKEPQREYQPAAFPSLGKDFLIRTAFCLDFQDQVSLSLVNPATYEAVKYHAPIINRRLELARNAEASDYRRLAFLTASLYCSIPRTPIIKFREPETPDQEATPTPNNKNSLGLQRTRRAKITKNPRFPTPATSRVYSIPRIPIMFREPKTPAQKSSLEFTLSQAYQRRVRAEAFQLEATSIAERVTDTLRSDIGELGLRSAQGNNYNDRVFASQRRDVGEATRILLSTHPKASAKRLTIARHAEDMIRNPLLGPTTRRSCFIVLMHYFKAPEQEIKMIFLRLLLNGITAGVRYSLVDELTHNPSKSFKQSVRVALEQIISNNQLPTSIRIEALRMHLSSFKDLRYVPMIPQDIANDVKTKQSITKLLETFYEAYKNVQITPHNREEIMYFCNQALENRGIRYWNPQIRDWAIEQLIEQSDQLKSVLNRTDFFEDGYAFIRDKVIKDLKANPNDDARYKVFETAFRASLCMYSIRTREYGNSAITDLLPLIQDESFSPNRRVQILQLLESSILTGDTNFENVLLFCEELNRIKDRRVLNPSIVAEADRIYTKVHHFYKIAQVLRDLGETIPQNESSARDARISQLCKQLQSILKSSKNSYNKATHTYSEERFTYKNLINSATRPLYEYGSSGWFKVIESLLNSWACSFSGALYIHQELERTKNRPSNKLFNRNADEILSNPGELVMIASLLRARPTSTSSFMASALKILLLNAVYVALTALCIFLPIFCIESVFINFNRAIYSGITSLLCLLGLCSLMRRTERSYTIHNVQDYFVNQSHISVFLVLFYFAFCNMYFKRLPFTPVENLLNNMLIKA